jgi:hypothetical protein
VGPVLQLTEQVERNEESLLPNFLLELGVLTLVQMEHMEILELIHALIALFREILAQVPLIEHLENNLILQETLTLK